MKEKLEQNWLNTESKHEHWLLSKVNIEDKNLLKNLYLIGYNKIRKLDYNLNKKFLFKAFQRRFRQSLINGKSDQECLLISKNLLKS